MSVLSPRQPLRADHRFLKKLIGIALKGKVVIIPSELSRVSRVFCEVGGSWERLFAGSVEEIVRLRYLLGYAHENGYLTKKEKW